MGATRRQRWPRWTVPAVAAAALACAHGPAAPAAPAPPAPRWPAPPEAPRIEFAGTLSPAADVGRRRGFWGSVAATLLGEDDERPGARLLDRPFGLAIAGATVYVADPDARRVVELSRTGDLVREVACPRAWAMPMAVALAADGSVFVADAAAGVVVRIRPGGCSELGAGALARPTGLALSGARLYVVDPPRHEVVAFSLDGAEQLRFGGHGAGPGQLNFPTAIAARANGELLVVDALNFRVTAFTAEGEVLGSFGEPGDGGGAFGRPKAVAVDAEGLIYVSDAQHDVVIVYDPSGRFLFAFGGTGSQPGALSLPAGLAVGGSTLYVADALNHRIQLFSIFPGAR